MLSISFLGTSCSLNKTPKNPTTQTPAELRIQEGQEGLSIHALCENLWIHTSHKKLSNGFLFQSNGLILKSDSGLYLIDTAWGSELTEELIAWVQQELGPTIKGAVLTHFHDDSIGGLSALRDKNIPYLVHPLTSKHVKADDSVAWVGNSSTGSTMHIWGMEIYYPGPSHSEDLIVVYLPEQNALFGSCAVRSPMYPGLGNTADAHRQDWPIAIDRLIEKYGDARIVIPGHGKAGDSNLLSHTKRVFRN